MKKISYNVFLIFTLIYTTTEARNLSPKRHGIKRPGHRIYEGQDALPGQFPYHAYYQDGPYICGASVIEPDMALTAAHCCSGVPVTQMTIDAGGIDRITLDGMQMIPVEMAIIHEDFNPRTLENDICLLLLADSFDYSDGTVNQIALAEANEKSDHFFHQAATITGWGKNEDGVLPQNLQFAEVYVMSDDECNDYIYGTNGDSITGDMICAGDLDDDEHTDACQGDSGGPLALGAMYINWEDRQQIGITSWGYGCGLNLAPGVYADVACLRDWIDENNPTRGRSYYEK